MGDFLLMDNGQPLQFDRAGASAYLKQTAANSSILGNVTATNMSNDLAVDRNSVPPQRVDNPVIIQVSIGNGQGAGQAWGCDLSYDYVKINAEYTT